MLKIASTGRFTIERWRFLMAQNTVFPTRNSAGMTKEKDLRLNKDGPGQMFVSYFPSFQFLSWIEQFGDWNHCTYLSQETIVGLFGKTNYLGDPPSHWKNIVTLRRQNNVFLIPGKVSPAQLFLRLYPIGFSFDWWPSVGRPWSLASTELEVVYDRMRKEKGLLSPKDTSSNCYFPFHTLKHFMHEPISIILKRERRGNRAGIMRNIYQSPNAFNSHLFYGARWIVKSLSIVGTLWIMISSFYRKGCFHKIHNIFSRPVCFLIEWWYDDSFVCNQLVLN